MIVYPVESQELSDTVWNEDNLEQQPFLRNEVKDTSKRSPTLRHEDEITNEARKSGSIVISRFLYNCFL